jgi:hypothetical protein
LVGGGWLVALAEGLSLSLYKIILSIEIFFFWWQCVAPCHSPSTEELYTTSLLNTSIQTYTQKSFMEEKQFYDCFFYIASRVIHLFFLTNGFSPGRVEIKNK